jgi:hypothetical protein
MQLTYSVPSACIMQTSVLSGLHHEHCLVKDSPESGRMHKSVRAGPS